MQLTQAQLWPWPAYAAMAGGALASLWWLRAVALMQLNLALCAAVLAFALTGWRATLQPALGEGVPEGQVVWIEGVVEPGVRDYGVSQRLSLAMTAWQPIGGAWQAREARVRLSWYRSPESVHLAAGQRWRFPVRLRAPHGYRNPGGYDRELRDWRAGVWASGTVVTQPALAPPELLQENAYTGMRLWREHTRERLQDSGVDVQWVPWLAALVLGDQGALSRQDWTLLRDTGTAHLVSISGLHVTVLAAWAYVAMGWLWRGVMRVRPSCWSWGTRALWSSGAAITAAVLYALFSGWGVPVQRATLMLVTASLLRSGARAWPAPTLWLWVAVVVLVWDPWALLQAGFWLSFVAVGLLFLRPKTYEAGWRWRDLLGAQAMMTVALAPLSAWWFGQVSVVGLLANLLAVPWVSVVVLPLALLGVLWSPAWSLAAWALGLMVQVLTWLQSWPLAVFSLTPLPAYWALLAVTGAGLLFLRWSWAVRLVCVWLIVPALVWRPERPAAGDFWVDALDVGQGSAVLVRTATHALLFDAGPSYGAGGSAGRSIIVPSLQAMGVKLNRLVLSHEDHDHVGGAVDVWQAYPDAQVLASFIPKFSARSETCHFGQHWVWDGVRFEVVHPFSLTPVTPPARAGNAQSCVLRVSSGRASALLMGDLVQAQEAELLRKRADWRTTLLVAAHHGSATSSSQAWMDAVTPDWVWVQAGYRNPYGHPAASVLQRWQDMGLPVRNTATCGMLSWRSAQPERSTCARTEQVRYWAHRPP